MSTVSFQSVCSTIRNAFKSHATLEAESNARLTPVANQIESIFERHGFSDGFFNDVHVTFEYFEELWESKFSLHGLYKKDREAEFLQVLEEANKLLRQHQIQRCLIYTKTDYVEVVHLFPEFIIPDGSSVKDIFMPRDGNWDR